MKFILIRATWSVVPLVILAFIPLAKVETPITPSPVAPGRALYHSANELFFWPSLQLDRAN